MIAGSCHCGAVNLSLSKLPEFINLCDCSLCLKSGGAWGYFASIDVEIAGQTNGYRRSDYPEPAVEMRFCSNCGTTTHWILTEHFDGDRVGVNMRIFEPSALDGIEARTLDGRSWQGEGDAAHRRVPGKLGCEVFL